MGNMTLSGLFRADATVSEPDSGERFIARKIGKGMIYFYAPIPEGEHWTPCPTNDSQTSSSPLLSDPSPHKDPSFYNQSDSLYSSRPLLLLFPWLGAQLGAVAKYRDLYMDRGIDVLVVQSGVMHFLWPRWGLEYGQEVLEVLEEPPFSGRPVLVHASSIGGFMFTQMLTHIAQAPKKYAGLAQRVIGHVYDSLVAGSLEHMAIGLGKTLVPRFEGVVKYTAMLYFWLFKTHTADLYDNGVRVFHNSPITAPALFFFSEDDALCNPVVVEKLIDLWRRRGVAVESRKWKESTHAAHMRCHPQDYISTLEKFLKSLSISSPKPKTQL